MQQASRRCCCGAARNRRRRAEVSPARSKSPQTGQKWPTRSRPARVNAFPHSWRTLEMYGARFRAKYVWARSQRGVELAAFTGNPHIRHQNKSTADFGVPVPVESL